MKPTKTITQIECRYTEERLRHWKSTQQTQNLRLASEFIKKKKAGEFKTPWTAIRNVTNHLIATNDKRIMHIYNEKFLNEEDFTKQRQREKWLMKPEKEDKLRRI